ncbi:hypothetical protein [Salmonella enterica]|uniref:Outer membrane lipoprotein n=2 Tax=Salmonella enterica TaxID=28901 RepID=A0A6C7CDJ8_SALER|nr:hypothetical protein [Salmonella enterica]ECC1483334.1 hypothetical protein [Salmonella enterica subsp. salamae]EHM1753163.1 hypothetical protein [Salmonella enterica subsp. salamae serovar 40:c:e,n,x,z15]HCM1918373.1 hypothetical protein [Salmonella enterica subsp. salamae serovar 28:r:e,n,z15]ASG90049.1 hypothetical protein LFZ47_22240 [Salmonella enterica subsp. salamae serovar 55:k:z39 str. 1315K]ECC1658175.1 hypothetical protein [Salmonella enterica subsp. salamae]
MENTMKLRYAITLLLCLLLSACSLSDRFSAVAFHQLTLLQARSTRFLQDAARIPWPKETLIKDDHDIRQTFFQAERFARQRGDKRRLDNLTLLKNHYLRFYARVMARKQPLTYIQAERYQQQNNQAWKLAIQGECLRWGARCIQGDENGVY